MFSSKIITKQNQQEKVIFSNAMKNHESLKNEKRLNKKLSNPKQYKEGKWDSNEHEIYLNFIKQNENLFANEFLRRSSKVFDQISQLLNSTRSSEQCRWHHKKFLKLTKGNSVDSILAYVGQKNKKQQQRQRVSEQMVNRSKIAILKENQRKYEIKVENNSTGGPLQIKIRLKFNFMNW